MSIFYRIVVILIAIAAIYTTYGIVHFKWMYHRAENPKIEFFVGGNPEGEIVVVEFLNYGCDRCKNFHPVVEEMLAVRTDVKHVVWPVVYGEGYTDRLVKLAIAAGLQGKFKEMHLAFLEHPEEDIPEDFIEETAALYGVDYDQLIEDAEGKKVQKIADYSIRTFEHVGLYTIPSFIIGKNIYIVGDDIPELKEFLTIISNAEKS